jgi:glycosidase
MGNELRDILVAERPIAKAAPSLPRSPQFPALYQINVRLRLRERADALGRSTTFDDIEDTELDRVAAAGFDWIWFLGVWQTGSAGRLISLTTPKWRHEFSELLPDFEERDVCGSCFAITGYSAHTDMGGNASLQRLRERLHARGCRLMLDFVPNHMAVDHPWVRDRPELFIRGSEADIARQPGNYGRIDTARGPAILAYGRDPYFPGWHDTLQLNYGEPAVRAAMQRELLSVAELCDGVRCDMAMLILPEVFQRTWGIATEPFWPVAIDAVRQRHPDFLFMAEVYWDLEWTLQQQGFDVTYDKRLYDRLRAGVAGPVRDHFRAGMDFQRKLGRFLENHDEPRAAGTFAWDVHQAAAIVTFLSPGVRFFHDGQFEGRKQHVPVHLCRGPTETPNQAVQEFYRHLLNTIGAPATRDGAWRLLEATSAWDGNRTHDGFIAFAWQGADGARLLVAVNYAPNQGQCYLRLPFPELAGRAVILADRMGPAQYERRGEELLSRGLYLDMPAWGYHVFDVSPHE